MIDLTTSIDELPLNIRPYNCLKNLGIETLGQLTKFTEQELLHVPNFGGVSLMEIKEVLKGLGLELAPSDRVPHTRATQGLPNYIMKEIERATDQFRNRRFAIETQKYEWYKNKMSKLKQKRSASEQQIATAENRATFLERDRIILLLRKSGLRFRSIGKLLGISGNRVHQICRRQARREAFAKQTAEVATNG